MYWEKTTFIVPMNNNNKLKITVHYIILFELIFMH